MTWLYHADLAGTLGALAAGVAPRRVVWNVRCSDIDFSRYSWKTRAVASTLAKLSRLPGAVACNSRAGIAAHERLGYAPRRWVHLPNGFDLAAWRPDAADRASIRMDLGIAPDEVALATVGRADPQKDYDTFLAASERAARANGKLRIVVIGRDTERLPIPEGLRGRIVVLGQRADVATVLRGMDAFCLASAYGEGFPNVVGEAMATGLPCVVTDVGDAAAIVGPCGFVVPARAPEALAAAILRLADLSAETRVGLDARARVAENFEIGSMRVRYRALLEEVAA